MGPLRHGGLSPAEHDLGVAGRTAGEEQRTVTVERRVIMLSRGGRLAAFAVQALGNGRSVACLDSPTELADWARPPVDLVLLDLPRHHRGIAYRQLRQRYRGPVLALLDDDDDGAGLPGDRGPLAVLHRPFSGEDLLNALVAVLTPPMSSPVSNPTTTTPTTITQPPTTRPTTAPPTTAAPTTTAPSPPTTAAGFGRV
jgi:DNA-binding response OmpR family regulator